MDWYIFNLDLGGAFSHKIEQEGTHRMAIMSYGMTDDGLEYTRISFVDFNDPEVDAKAIDNGTFTRFESVSDATVDNQIQRSGVRGQGLLYANKASRQGAMDYGHSGAIVYGDLNKNTLYVRDEIAYNIGDYGNYLWGKAMGEMGFSFDTMALGAHGNNFWNGWQRGKDTSTLYDFGPGTYGPPSILDSQGDQRAILKGYLTTPTGRKWQEKEQRIKKEYERKRTNNPKFTMKSS